MHPPPRQFFGCPLDPLSREEILTRAQRALHEKTLLVIEGLNVAKLVQARRDAALMQALNEADIVHVDGAGIALGAKLLGHHLPPRRAGIDLMADLLELCAAQNVSVFLLGATADIVTRAAQAFTKQFPTLMIAGTRDGYFTDTDAASVAEAIRSSGAGLLLVGISSPKKEVFLQRYKHQLGVQLAMGVGGAFDVAAGIISRAPRWMQHCGLEWLFRLINEPRRLAWRYVDTNFTYGYLLLTALFRRGAP